ncbi:ABC transporter substrate-binding protein [Nioella nitratireducens]|uniref:ABC transporter substrate-binding protein n=1 Tax=Nioella nitratireducens TaxID=1287720 RepID=UPI0008FD5D98|nr:ABC transporter substrate-binding protein [Nioella nitratireducens]
MRTLILSLALTLLALPLRAYEVEEHVRFPSERAGPELRVISTADVDLFTPFILGFQARNPGISVDYYMVSSSEIEIALTEDGAQFDLAISSAMDQQLRLANDGLVQSYRSTATASLPTWARWRDRVFAFTQEPAAIVLSRADFEGLPLPRTRQDLITALREHPERFQGRIGTYDVRESGLGYLFATQDGRSSETFWRLTQVIGGLGPRLYCCSSDMIEDTASGRIAVAYNVLGSYAQAREDLHDRIHVIAPEDFTTVLMRTVVIPVAAEQPAAAGLFIDHLIENVWFEDSGRFAFPGITSDSLTENASLRPIQLGPGLLVYLDRLKRQQFMEEWEAAMVQPG